MHIVFSKLSSRPDCIFEIHQLWQSGFSRVYSNCCCSFLFEPEIIKIGQSSHKIYSNNILNFQTSATILNAYTKKSENLLNTPRISMWHKYAFNIYKYIDYIPNPIVSRLNLCIIFPDFKSIWKEIQDVFIFTFRWKTIHSNYCISGDFSTPLLIVKIFHWILTDSKSSKILQDSCSCSCLLLVLLQLISALFTRWQFHFFLVK